MARGFMEPIGCSDCGDCVPIEEAQARIEKLERMVVWAVENGATLTPPAVLSYNESGFGSCVRVLQLASDAPASILAAVEKAMGEK